MLRALPSGLFAALLVFVLTGCEAPSPDADLSETSGAAAAAFPDGELVDLSHPFNDESIYWPTATQEFELEEEFVGDTGNYFYASHVFRGAEHGGTHIDAPFHFAESAEAAEEQFTVEEIPIERLVGPAVVIDVSEQATDDRLYQVQVSDFEAWETEHGRIPNGAMVLLNTGSAQFYPDREAYMGTAERGEEALPDLAFPGLHPDAAEWLVANRSVSAVGLDTPSIDYGPSEDFAAHRILFPENIAVFENLTNLNDLPPTGAHLIALPMKIEGAGGAPLRAVAVLP
ncbi:MAG: cyclase family protein [Longimonas sp.]|uniref:cyclase family protein n=1 Tax=Longimonas sp. TaxID=2039626 RepID=UPI00335735E8